MSPDCCRLAADSGTWEQQTRRELEITWLGPMKRSLSREPGLTLAKDFRARREPDTRSACCRGETTRPSVSAVLPIPTANLLRRFYSDVPEIDVTCRPFRALSRVCSLIDIKHRVRKK